MDLGMFCMPLHRPEKPWAQALAEDREAVLLAEQLGFSEVWMGEHYSTSVERVPSPFVFLATLIAETSNIRFGTGVINLPHHHPAIVAAEAAMFDQLSGGRLMLGVGPGGLPSDAELFGDVPIGERVKRAADALDIIIRLWTEDAPLSIESETWPMTLEHNVWRSHGVGTMTRPAQIPHPPIAMAMVGPGGPTAVTIATRDFIPISANFAPLENIAAQWATYAETRQTLGKPADRSVWRVCRNILITDSQAETDDLLADPDGPFAFYFRYLRGLRALEEVNALEREGASLGTINAAVGVEDAYRECVIAGTADTVIERLIEVIDHVGRFGTLVMVGHDFDERATWQRSMRCLAGEVMPALRQHVG